MKTKRRAPVSAIPGALTTKAYRRERERDAYGRGHEDGERLERGRWLLAFARHPSGGAHMSGYGDPLVELGQELEG